MRLLYGERREALAIALAHRFGTDTAEMAAPLTPDATRAKSPASTPVTAFVKVTVHDRLPLVSEASTLPDEAGAATGSV